MIGELFCVAETRLSGAEMEKYLLCLMVGYNSSRLHRGGLESAANDFAGKK
jgi:hypothetical protein